MKLITILLFFIINQVKAQDTSAIRLAAKAYANAITNRNDSLILKLTPAAYIKAMGGKNVLLHRFKQDETDMIKANEKYVKSEINQIGKAINTGSNSYTMIEFKEIIQTPGGLCSIIIPYVAVKAKTDTWQFFEAEHLNVPSVRSILKPLIKNISIPRRGMRTFLLDQQFTKEMGKYNWSFKGQIRRYELNYIEPNGYLASDSAMEVVDSVVGHHYSTIRYSLRSKDGILIGITFNGPIDDDGKLNGFPGTDGLPYDPNKNWIPIFHWAYKVLPKEYTKNTYNADLAAVYNFYQHKNVPVLDPNESCRSIIIHKDNVVDIEIMYFYTPQNEHLLKKHMEETEHMLKFKGYIN